MSIPIQTRLLQPFLGMQEGVGLRLLTSAYSPRESFNIIIDELGKIRKWGGYLEIGAAPAASTRFTNVRYFDGTVSSGGWRYLYGFAGSATSPIYYADVTAANTLSNTGDIVWSAMPGTSGYGDLPDHAIMDRSTIVTRPGSAPIYIFGNAAAGVAYTQLAAPTYGATAAGNLTGNYKWKILPVIGQTRKWASTASANQVLAANNQVVNWVADADVTVTGYEVYRTTGTGQSFWYVTSISGRTTVTYTDNTTDATIIGNRTLLEHGDPPPSVWFCETHKQRMWYGNLFSTGDDDKRKIWYSDPGDFRSVFQDTSFFNLTDERSFGDQIVGMTGDFKNQLVVWMTRGVYTISGTGAVLGLIPDWTLKRTNATIGTVGHRTVCEVPVGAKYTDPTGVLRETAGPTLAFVSSVKDIRIFDGNSDQIISTPVRDSLLAMNLPDSSGYSYHPHVFHDFERNQMIWYLPLDAASTLPSHAVVWNYRLGTWSILKEQDFGAVTYVAGDTSVDPYIIVGLQHNALGADCRTWRLYERDTGEIIGVQDGDYFASQLRLGPLYFATDPADEPDFSSVKRFRFIDFLFADPAETNSNSVQMTAKFFTTLKGSEDDISADTPDLSSNFNSSLYQSIPLKTTSGALPGRYLHSRGLSMILTETLVGGDDFGPWTLEGIRVGYQVLPGWDRD